MRPGPLGTPETDAAHLNGHRPLPGAGATTISKTSARQFTTRLRAKQVATRTPRREGSMRVALDDKSTVEDRLFGTARAGGTGRRSTRLAAGPSPAGYRLSARQRPGSSGLRRAARPCCLCQDQCPAHPRSEEGYPPPTSLSAIPERENAPRLAEPAPFPSGAASI